MLLIKQSQYILRPPKLVRTGADAQALEEGNVDLGIDSTVVVTAGWGDAAGFLQGPEMLWGYTEPTRGFRNV